MNWSVPTSVAARREDLPMATTAENVTWQYRHLWIAVQFSISYKMQLTRSRLSGDENLSPRIDERHVLHSVVCVYASTG